MVAEVTGALKETLVRTNMLPGQPFAPALTKKTLLGVTLHIPKGGKDAPSLDPV